MINPKNISICSAIGFFLSFFIGLVSPGVNFSHVLLRAVLFALLFAALCVGVTFIYKKFLSVDTNSFGVESEPNLQKTAGGVVNIVIDDSNLADDGMAPRFTVLNNHSVLGAKTASAEKVQEQKQEPIAQIQNPEVESVAQQVQKTQESANPVQTNSPSFTPASLDSVTQKSEPAKAAPSQETVQKEQNAVAQSSSSEQNSNSPASQNQTAPTELDELPDIGSMEMTPDSESTSDFSSANEEIVTDTDFSTGGAHLKEQPISGDTNVMAKAIQTLLSQDNG